MELNRFRSAGGNFVPAPEGVHNAICVAVIDIGTQESTYQGKVRLVPKIILRWEIDEPMEDGRRFIVQQRYTQSVHEKATLRHHLEAWRGRAFTDAELGPGGFSMAKLLGAGCQLQLIHEAGQDGTVYSNIAAVMKLGKGMKALTPEVEPFMLDLESAETFDRGVFEALSDRLKEVIARSPEFQALLSPAAVKLKGKADVAAAATADFDDEIPF